MKTIDFDRAKKGFLPTTERGYTDTFNELIADIKARLDRHETALIVIEGDPGSGKSSAAVSIASRLDNRFDPSLHVIFSAREFLELVNYLLDGGDERFRGAFVVFDEAGSGLSIGASASVQGFLNELETFRAWQIVPIFTVPMINRIPDAIRNGLITHRLWVIRHSPDTQQIYARAKVRVRLENQILFVNPRAVSFDYVSQSHSVNFFLPYWKNGLFIKIPYAAPEYWDKYTDLKTRFFKLLTDSAIDRIDRVKDKRSDHLATEITLNRVYTKPPERKKTKRKKKKKK